MNLTYEAKKALNEGHKVYHFEPNEPAVEVVKVGGVTLVAEITESGVYNANQQPIRYQQD
jgi:hypothetical protein